MRSGFAMRSERISDAWTTASKPLSPKKRRQTEGEKMCFLHESKLYRGDSPLVYPIAHSRAGQFYIYFPPHRYPAKWCSGRIRGTITDMATTNIVSTKRLLLFGLIGAVITTASACADVPVTPYPRLPGMPIVSEYRLSLDGREVAVYEHPAGRFAILRANAKVGLTMERMGKPVSSAVLRPTACVSTPTVEGGRIHIQLPGPGTYALELDGEQLTPLFLFVKPPESIPDPASVTYFFAPGKVHELPGNVLTLKAGESAYIAGGAVVKGSINVGVPQDAEGYGKGARIPVKAPSKDIRIAGQGVISPSEKGMPMAVFNAEKVLIEGLTVLNTNQWTLRLFNVSKSTISGVHVFSTGKYSDGIDLLGCTDIVVRDSFFRSEDDCVSIKGQKFDVVGGNVERIVLENLVIWHGLAGNGIEIGWELGVDHVKDITVRRCHIMHSDGKPYPFRRAALSIHNSGGAAVSNILYEDVSIEQAREGLIRLWVGKSDFTKGSTKIGSITDVTYRRLRYLDGPALPITIDSQKAPGNIKNITFEDCRLLGKQITKHSDMELNISDAPNPTIR